MANVQAGQGVPQTTGVAQSSQIQQSAIDVDPIAKFQLLLPTLKHSLVNLMKISSQVLQQNGFTDGGRGKLSESPSPQQKFEKSLEEFYSICDQIEVNLRLALETHCEIADSVKNTPVPLHGQKLDSTVSHDGQTSQSGLYSQYLTIVQAQINCAKELHEMLTESARKLGES
ncbi:mediator of RNA polymerase II transcription subunit 29-like [Liolophura sinensis]|uniref:mediator of RNA polymerase II transcription subunit 29-like n=1 Tax=Liolophura sinensis TaxID=3198878 RepID=UPI003158C075